MVRTTGLAVGLPPYHPTSRPSPGGSPDAPSHRPRPRLEPLEDRTTPAAGQLDTTFHVTGRQLVPFSPPANTYDLAYAVAVAPDGGVVLGGTTAGEFTANETTAAVVKLTATGNPDPAFSTNGRASFSFLLGDPTAISRVVAVATFPDGRVLAAGSVIRTLPTFDRNHDFAVARLTATGQPDPTVGVNGWAVVPFDLFAFAGGENEDIARGMAIDSLGRIVLAGNVSTGDMSFRMFGAARLTPDGQLDGTFDGDGRLVYGLNLGGDQRDQAFAVRVDSVGRVVLAGEATASGSSTDGFVVRLLSSGLLDPAFNSTGLVRFGFDRGGGNYDTAKAVTIDATDRVVVAGWSQVPDAPGGQFATDTFATRILPGGALDPAFGVGGTAIIDFTPESGDPGDAASAVTLDAAGRVVVAGSAFHGTNTGLSDFAVARLTADSVPNTAPTVSDVPNQTVPAGGTTGALTVNVSDAETAAASLALTASSSNTALVPAGAISLGGSGGTRTVTVAPAAGQSGTTTITLTVTTAAG